MWGILWAFLTLLILLRYLVKRYYRFWEERGFPYLQPSFPFGNLSKLCMGKQYPGEAYQEIYNSIQGKKYCGVFHFFRPVLVLRDREEIANFLTKDFQHFPARDEELDRKLEFMSQTLFHMQNKDEWKILRSKLAKTFSTNKLKNIFQEMIACSERLVERLDRHADVESVEMKDFATEFITDVVFSCFFGLTVHTMGKEQSEIKAVQVAMAIPKFTTVTRMILYNISTKLPLLLKVRLMPKYVTGFFTRLTNELIKYREESGTARKDFFDVLMQIKNESDSLKNGCSPTKEVEFTEQADLSFKMETDTMAAQCFLFYAGAFDPVSFSLSACLTALAKHTDIQAKVQAEVDEISKKYGGKITYESLEDMNYLCQVVAESLRMMPPVPDIVRKCAKRYQTADGLIVEKGVRVVVPVYAIHRDPELYPDPDEFKPERFAGMNLKSRPTYPFMPFGDGPRSCLGMRFGILQLRFGIATIMERYSVQLDPRSTFPLTYSPKIFVVSVSKDGFWLKFSRRSKK